MPRIRLVEQSYLTCNNVPFKISLDGLASLFHLMLFPLKEFITAGKCEQSFLVECEGRRTDAYTKRRCGWMMTLSRLARTKQLL